MANPKTLARIAGGLYLLLAILGGWAQLAARGSIFIPGDAAKTAANIVENETMFRLSIAADIGMALTFVLLGLALYRLLYAENARWANALLVFISVAAGSILINLTFQVGALVVATDPAYASFDDSLVLLLMDLHQHGYALGGIFFGLWLLPVGIIALRSPLFHRALGIIVVIGAIAWLFDPLFSIAPAEFALVRSLVSIPTVVAELGIIVYLLVVGVRTQKTVA